MIKIININNLSIDLINKTKHIMIIEIIILMIIKMIKKTFLWMNKKKLKVKINIIKKKDNKIEIKNKISILKNIIN